MGRFRDKFATVISTLVTKNRVLEVKAPEPVSVVPLITVDPDIQPDEIMPLLQEFQESPEYQLKSGDMKKCHFNGNYDAVILEIQTEPALKPNAPVRFPIEERARAGGVDTPRTYNSVHFEHAESQGDSFDSPRQSYSTVYSVQERAEGVPLASLLDNKNYAQVHSDLSKRSQRSFDKLVRYCIVINEVGGHCDQHANNIFVGKDKFTVIDLMPAGLLCPHGDRYIDLLRDQIMFDFFNQCYIGKIENPKQIPESSKALARKIIQAYCNNGIGQGQPTEEQLEKYIMDINRMNPPDIIDKVLRMFVEKAWSSVGKTFQKEMIEEKEQTNNTMNSKRTLRNRLIEVNPAEIREYGGGDGRGMSM